jgi:hypothetical protein
MGLSVYRFPALYGLGMRLAYRGDFPARYALVAAQLPGPTHVLEVCYGDLRLHDHLQREGLLLSYVGLDGAPAMVARGRARGLDVRIADLRARPRLPEADTVIMQASLYQFHEIAEALVQDLWAAARRRLLLAEPVRNLARSPHALVRWLGLALSRTDDRAHPFRYTEETLLAVYRRAGVPVTRLARTPAGREVLVVSEKGG